MSSGLFLVTRESSVVNAAKAAAPLTAHNDVDHQRRPATIVQCVAKRLIDIVIACSALIALSPVLIIIALAIRLDSPGPILFRQTRRGFNHAPFQILKFRSMRVMEDGAIVPQARRCDARVTHVGRWIRRTSLDELPQLWNVLRGDMSLVGPRPHAVAHDRHYEALLSDYAVRRHMKPGLTGWAQINGSRGETPTVESMAQRVSLDVWYVRNRSTLLDLKIMLRTLVQIVDVDRVY